MSSDDRTSATIAIIVAVASMAVVLIASVVIFSYSKQQVLVAEYHRVPDWRGRAQAPQPRRRDIVTASTFLAVAIISSALGVATAINVTTILAVGLPLAIAVFALAGSIATVKRSVMPLPLS